MQAVHAQPDASVVEDPGELDIITASIRQFQNRVDALKLLLETLQQYHCFDEEDCSWVAAEIVRLEKEREQDEARITQLITTLRELEERKLQVHHRQQVLTDMDDSTDCLKRNKRLRNKFVKKQAALQAEIDKLQKELERHERFNAFAATERM